MVITSEFVAPESPVMLEQRDTKAVLNNQDLGVGTLYVSERTLCWKQEEGEAASVNQGFTIEYKDITAHAVANDNKIYPEECLYILIDKEEGYSGGDNDEPEEGYAECVIWELILVPSDHAGIDLLFNALNQAQLLNPDPADFSDVDSLFEDAEDEFDNHDFGGGGDSEMNALLNQMQNYSVCNGFHDHTDEEQFEDAD